MERFPLSTNAREAEAQGSHWSKSKDWRENQDCGEDRGEVQGGEGGEGLTAGWEISWSGHFGR